MAAIMAMGLAAMIATRESAPRKVSSDLKIPKEIVSIANHDY
jgi:hypothetical protein